MNVNRHMHRKRFRVSNITTASPPRRHRGYSERRQWDEWASGASGPLQHEQPCGANRRRKRRLCLVASARPNYAAAPAPRAARRRRAANSPYDGRPTAPRLALEGGGQLRVEEQGAARPAPSSARRPAGARTTRRRPTRRGFIAMSAQPRRLAACLAALSSAGPASICFGA